MAEFTLPANSKVGPGKVFPAPAGAKRVRDFKVYRWGGNKPFRSLPL